MSKAKSLVRISQNPENPAKAIVKLRTSNGEYLNCLEIPDTMRTTEMRLKLGEIARQFIGKPDRVKMTVEAFKAHTGVGKSRIYGGNEPKPHPHAALIMEWAQDMAKDQSIVWQHRPKGTDKWRDISVAATPVFFSCSDYRRKPTTLMLDGEEVKEGDVIYHIFTETLFDVIRKNGELHYMYGGSVGGILKNDNIDQFIRTIRIGDDDVPMPLQVKPNKGDKYWIFNVYGRVEEFIWQESIWDIDTFNNGFCHSTKRAAELHAKALISFTNKG